MSKKIGFIGCGNMGGAMLAGILDSGKCTAQEVMVSASSEKSAADKREKYGVTATADNCAVAAFADILFLTVKPQYYAQVIDQIRESVSDDTIIITVAPGKTLTWLAKRFGGAHKIIRTMPNTPSLVKEGMMGMCANSCVTEEDIAVVRDICDGFSRTELVAENLMDVVTAVSGSSPAYVFMFIEAMADAAVAGGMPRSQAYTFAAQAVLGSAKMVLETGKHPGELKDMVCSPAGTTIQAVRVLEEKGMRSAVIEAMEKCLDISRNM